MAKSSPRRRAARRHHAAVIHHARLAADVGSRRGQPIEGEAVGDRRPAPWTATTLCTHFGRRLPTTPTAYRRAFRAV